MKKLALLLFTFQFCSSLLSFGQNENNIWAFGSGNGIDFNVSPPVVIGTAISSVEGAASVCDASGNLLFYSNGITVWDNTNTPMPNGSGLFGAPSKSSTQGVAIAPVAGSPNLYFIFSLEEYSTTKTGKFWYSVVDMSLNGGKGDVVSTRKNILVGANMSEKMITAPACNGVWLITHHIDSAIFYAYKVNALGVLEAPVISHTAGHNIPENYYVGEMKLSPDETKIAMGNWLVKSNQKPQSRIELFDFNPKTGLVSGYYNIDSCNIAYSLEFSPDNSKLYVGFYSSRIYQYDLSLLPSTSAVLASRYDLGGSVVPSSLRLGPDNKIYIKKGAGLARILNPNVAGVGCNLEVSSPGFTFSSSGYFLCFGNRFVNPLISADSTFSIKHDTTICDGLSISFPANNFYTKFVWNDGDTNRAKVISTSGRFWRRATVGCTALIDTFDITLQPINLTSKTIDTQVCFANDFILEGSSGFSQYLWHNGVSTKQQKFTTNVLAWVIGSDKACNMSIDTFNVKLTNFKVVIPDTFICAQQSIVLDATTENATKYLWQDSSNTKTYTANKPGIYWVKVSQGNCDYRANIIIGNGQKEINIGSDTAICEFEPITLIAENIPNASYLWNTGSTSNRIVVDKEGKYSVTVNNNGCISGDEIQILTKRCQNCILIPNAFTPNNDGLNDAYKAITFCPFDKFEMIIMNRYGEQVFRTNSPNKKWDGTYKNLELSSGVYYYLINVVFSYPNAKEEIYKGDISLLR